MKTNVVLNSCLIPLRLLLGVYYSEFTIGIHFRKELEIFSQHSLANGQMKPSFLRFTHIYLSLVFFSLWVKFANQSVVITDPLIFWLNRPSKNILIDCQLSSIRFEHDLGYLSILLDKIKWIIGLKFHLLMIVGNK